MMAMVMTVMVIVVATAVIRSVIKWRLCRILNSIPSGLIAKK